MAESALMTILWPTDVGVPIYSPMPPVLVEADGAVNIPLNTTHPPPVVAVWLWTAGALKVGPNRPRRETV